MNRPIWVLPGWKPQRHVFSCGGSNERTREERNPSLVRLMIRQMYQCAVIQWDKISGCFSEASYSFIFEPLHDKTNKMTVCPAKTQISLGIWIKCTVKTLMPQLIRVFAGRTCHFVGFIMRWLILCVWTVKTLARLCRYTGTPEPSLFAYVVSTIFTWAGPIYGASCNEVMLSSLCLIFLVPYKLHYTCSRLCTAYMWTLPDLQGGSLKWAQTFLLKHTTFYQTLEISLIWFKYFPIYSIHFSWKTSRN